MRRVGSRGMDIILVGRKSVKRGVQFIKAQKKWGRKEKAKGDKGLSRFNLIYRSTPAAGDQDTTGHPQL